MLRPGLVSVTFRALSPRQIIDACLEAGLEGIEWGGDVHVPDFETAREVGQMTREAGLEVAAYGSYFRCDTNFGDTAVIAEALGAPLVRVWAGQTDARQASEDNWERVGHYLSVARAMGDTWGFEVATEFHSGTLAADGPNARRLVESCAGAQTLWQPLRCGPDFEPQIAENLEDLRAVAPFLSNVHVYEWANDANGERQRLSLEGSTQWPLYIEKLKQIGGARWLLLEFVPDDDPQILAREAAALRALIKGGAP